MSDSQDAPKSILVRRAISQLERLGATANALVYWSGGLSRMLIQAVARGPRPPFSAYNVSHQVLQLGIRSLPLATMMAGFVGMILTWQFGKALDQFGAKAALGYTTSLALVRELVPTVLALTVGTKMATGMTAELGSMKVTEQIDAIAALGADPIKKLVWPRLLGATLAMPLLVAWGNVVALVAGMLISDQVFNVPAAYFYSSYVYELVPLDYVNGLVKALCFGGLAGLIGCFQGFRTGFGTEAVGASTTDAVIAVSVTVLLADFALTTIFLPLPV